MSNDEKAKRAGFEDLVAIMERLRDPEKGCPWDVKQDWMSIKDYFLEEVHEAVEAIEANDAEGLKEELGDCLMEIVFLAQIAKEQGDFDIYDSLEGITTKLIRRHPHVFGEEHIDDADKVLSRWMEIKAEEKAQTKKARDSILEGVPKKLPGLLQAYRISQRAVAVGFEWEDVEAVLEKLDEEIGELKEAIEEGASRERLEDELGDVLFTAVNVGRKLKIRPHDALSRTLVKFRKRFFTMEKILKERGESVEGQTIEVLEPLWQEAKRRERNGEDER